MSSWTQVKRRGGACPSRQSPVLSQQKGPAKSYQLRMRRTFLLAWPLYRRAGTYPQGTQSRRPYGGDGVRRSCPWGCGDPALRRGRLCTCPSPSGGRWQPPDHGRRLSDEGEGRLVIEGWKWQKASPASPSSVPPSNARRNRGDSPAGEARTANGRPYRLPGLVFPHAYF